MIRFHTLGAVSLSDAEGGDCSALLPQARRMALLTYLVLASPRGFHRRDTLIGQFWPELDQHQARQALRQGIYVLRQALGGGLIISRGDDEVAADGARLRCDAVEFEQLIEAGRLEEALALYRGDLLEGFFVAGAPGFERWLEDERARLRNRAAAVARALADHRTTTGGTAVEWARRAVALAPADESDLRRLIRAIDRAGDRAGAIHAYTEGARRLGEDFGIQPSAETLSLIEEIRARAPSGPGHLFDPVLSSLPGGQPPAATPSPRRVQLATMIGLALPVVLAAVWAVWPPAGERAGDVQPLRLVVLPFRSSGADRSLAYLGEGMVDLLVTKLNGAGGAQTVDARSTLSAWQRTQTDSADPWSTAATARLAAALGARQVISGVIIGDPRRLVLQASLVTVPSGAHLAVAEVEGPEDSLLYLVDRLAAALLLRRAGEDEQRLPQLTSVSLQAVRAYLDGEAAYRRGEYQKAITAYGRAVGEDSTFALAALGLVWAASSGGDIEDYARAKHLAWAAQDRLDPLDRRVLRAFAGPHYPHNTVGRVRLNAFDSLVGAAPYRADLWFELGDALYHDGPAVDARLAHQRAAAAFERALELDPGFAAPLEHLVDLAATAGDTARVRALGARYLAEHPGSDKADYLRWRIALAQGDSALLRSLQARFGDMQAESLERIIGVAQLDGIGLDGAERAMAALRARVSREQQRANAWTGSERLRMVLALNRGRPREAEAAIDALADPAWLGGNVARALYWEGGIRPQAPGTADLATLLTAPLPGAGRERYVRFTGACLAGQWAVMHGDTAEAILTLPFLRQMAADTVAAPPWGYDELCERTLEARLAFARGGPLAGMALDQLDSLAIERPYGGIGMFTVNLAIAQLREAQGDRAAALRAVRRRPHHWIIDGLWGLSTYLREEGRLAALVGDTAGAVAAYRHYLALRSDPDPELVPEVRRVRAELARIQ